MLKSVFGNGVLVSVLTICQFFVLFISQIILARIIAPEIFGIFAIISAISMFFYTLCNLNTDKYLIKEQKEIEAIMDTTFTIEIMWTIFVIIFGILVLPTLLEIFSESNILIYCQIYLIACLSNPFLKLKSLMEKKSNFVLSSFPLVFSSIISSTVAILMAYNGFTIWALIVWRCLSYFLEGSIILIISDYKPKFKFDLEIIKKSLNFTYPLTLSAIIAFIYTNIDYLIIDKLMDKSEVGFYWLAYQTSHYFLAIRSSINKVVYPVLSRMNSYKTRIELFSHMNVITSFIYLIPLLLIVFLGEEIITYIYGSEWIGSVILFKIFMIIILFKAVASSAGPLLHVNGNTQNDLEIALISLIALPICMICFIHYLGLIGAAASVGFVSVFSSYYVYQRYIKKITGHGYIYYFGRIIFIIICVLLAEYFIDSMSIFINFIYIILFLLISLFLYRYEIKKIVFEYRRG